MKKKLLILIFTAFIVGIFIFVKTSVSLASTLYFNDLTSNLDGWQIWFNYGSPNFSSDGLNSPGDSFGYNTSLTTLKCESADIKTGTTGDSSSGVGMTDITFDGTGHTFGHAVLIHAYAFNGTPQNIKLEQVHVNEFSTGVNTPVDGQYHNYMLCRDGATYTVYLDQTQIYSTTLDSNYSNNTYPYIFVQSHDYMKNFTAYDTNPSSPTPTPTPSPTPTVQSQLTYYNVNDGSSFSRATSPSTSGVSTQTANSDGSVTVSVNSATSYADSGIVLYEGTLGNLPDFTVNGTGDQFGLNIWLDTSNNNEFFAWDSNGVLTGLGGDTYALGPTSSSGADAVTGSSQFYLMSDGQNHSLSDLKSGAVSGISSSTKVAIWIGVNTSSGSTSATINSISGL